MSSREGGQSKQQLIMYLIMYFISIDIPRVPQRDLLHRKAEQLFLHTQLWLLAKISPFMVRCFSFGSLLIRIRG